MNRWYHGFISLQEAERRVLMGGKKGTFLIRCSSSSPGSYAITVLGEKKVVQHYRVSHVGGYYEAGKAKFKTLLELVKKCKPYMGMKTPASGSAYGYLFIDQPTIAGYQIVYK